MVMLLQPPLSRPPSPAARPGRGRERPGGRRRPRRCRRRGEGGEEASARTSAALHRPKGQRPLFRPPVAAPSARPSPRPPAGGSSGRSRAGSPARQPRVEWVHPVPAAGLMRSGRAVPSPPARGRGSARPVLSLLCPGPGGRQEFHTLLLTRFFLHFPMAGSEKPFSSEDVNARPLGQG